MCIGVAVRGAARGIAPPSRDDELYSVASISIGIGQTNERKNRRLLLLSYAYSLSYAPRVEKLL